MGMKVNLTIGIPSWLDKICAWPVTAYRKWKYGYTYRRIYLGEGEWTILDQEDYYHFREFNWRLFGNGCNLYAVRDAKIEPKRTRTVYLHREILKAPKGLLVDHRNGNGLDNRRGNIRLATYSQNNCNRRRDKSKCTSRYHGVYYEKQKRKWVARIYYKGKSLWLGGFDNEIDAARVYDAAAKKYYGEFAHLNFPYTRTGADF